MKTKYLIWKNPTNNGANPDWLEITGQQFYNLVNSPEAKGRYFIKLDAFGEDDNRIVLESTKTKYDEWYKEKRHKRYLRDVNPGYTQVS